MSTNKPANRARGSAIVAARYSGPIPSADEFQKYEAVLPGAANRILKMAEDQSIHRQKLESSAIKSGIENSKRGQIFGFIIAVLVIVVGFILILLGKDGLGLASIIAALVSLVGVFVYARQSERKERERKNTEENPRQNIQGGSSILK